MLNLIFEFFIIIIVIICAYIHIDVNDDGQISLSVLFFLIFHFNFRGKKDTKASIRLNRDGKELDFTVVRKPFRLKGK